jgi:2-polyprenyl-3-methyl-5-hydroxy-6-metoxy-1,4-benzoquinol methylase
MTPTRTAGVPASAPSACPLCGAPGPARHAELPRYDVYRCADCTLRFRHPLPTPDELTAMYEDERYHASAYFENARTGYDERAPEVRIYRRALRDLAESGTRRRRLLDVGCATGVFLDLARAAGWQVRGVELSTRHAAYARDAFGLDVWEGDFLDAPLSQGGFDAITMWDFLEHVMDPHAVLAKARDLLTPGGVLLVFTIDTSSLFNRIGDVIHRTVGAGRILELLYDSRHNYYFTGRSLRRLLERSGFQVARWRADRAYLGRWLAEPAPFYVVMGGSVVDFLSLPLRLEYRRTALCTVDGPARAP